MAKATVQAALGPVALKHITDKHSSTDNPEEFEKLKYYADAILVICILSIVVTAPIGGESENIFVYNFENDIFFVLSNI